jgi:hypothetical protein
MTQIISNVARAETNKNTRPFLAYFGHHKAGSSSIISILDDVCDEICLRRSGYQNGAYDVQKTPGYDLKKFVEENKVDFASYRNADYDHVKNLTNYRGFHVIRDPRDILVSAYFSHLYSHTTKNWGDLIAHREELQKLSKEEGLLAEMEFSSVNFEKMYNWNYSLPNVLELKMEDLFQDSQTQFAKIFDFLGILESSNYHKDQNIQLNTELIKTINRIHLKTKGLFPIKFSKNKISSKNLKKIIHQNSFSKKAKGRKKGQEDTKNHYRKGVHGDWKNHFNSRHILTFKDNYNDLIVKLGYESNPDWWKAYL